MIESELHAKNGAECDICGESFKQLPEGFIVLQVMAVHNMNKKSYLVHECEKGICQDCTKVLRNIDYKSLVKKTCGDCKYFDRVGKVGFCLYDYIAGDKEFGPICMPSKEKSCKRFEERDKNESE